MPGLSQRHAGPECDNKSVVVAVGDNKSVAVAVESYKKCIQAIINEECSAPMPTQHPGAVRLCKGVQA
eukprot:scaffold263337_cov17-Tisochrysis_lutea.AAC.1